ncbi:phosphocholine cytidylyltransferase family protein [Hyphococcus sp.]|uniref:phosphocholine cytidylyltransferase family protein n=1 Tax=Hyphococcus sp. TaxID=2038636 RepID=UPI0035C6A5D7
MTKVVILCAGQGTRLRPLTDSIPKGMVPLLGKPMLFHQLEAIEAAGVEDVSLVTGYAAETLEGVGTHHFHNERFADTNMVVSLFCASPLFDGTENLIIAYSDIVYEPRILEALIAAPGPLATVIDRNWLALWRERMPDPLADAESLKLNPDGTLLEIGQRAASLADIEGQYIGLTKVSPAAQRNVLAFYDNLDRNAQYAGRSFDQMFMTEFLTRLIAAGFPIHAAAVESGWLETDTLEDLQKYEALAARGELTQFWRPAE